MLTKDVFRRISFLLMGRCYDILHISAVQILSTQNLTMKKAIGSVRSTTELVKNVFHVFKKVISLG